MRDDPSAPRDVQEAVAAIARMLHCAAAQSSRQASAEGPRSALHVLSLAVHIAAAEVALLVPPELDPYWPRPVQADPLELLRAAKRLSRTVPAGAERTDLERVLATLTHLPDGTRS